MYDLIIIGGGPAGLTAAVYARRAGLSTLILEITVCGGQIINSQNVENFPAIPQIEGWRLADNWQKQAQALGAEIKTAAVTGIELRDNVRLVHTAKGDFEALAVIIATGAGHRKLDCPGGAELSGRGVSTCASCDGAFFRGRPVAVVGGGNTAFEDALYLSSICERVYIVHRRREFRAERHLVETAKAKANVEFLTPCVPAEVVAGANGRVAALRVRNVETNEERTLDTPGVFTAIGMIPNNAAFANVLKLDEAGYAIAGEDCASGTPGIWVAGDGRQKSLRQLITAAADGAVAATAAARYVNERK